MSKRIISILFFISIISGLTAQTDSLLFDHNKALERLENSENELFSSILKQYNEYLVSDPTNLNVLIERLQFVEYAQYDDYEEINPNQDLLDSLLKQVLLLYPEKPQVVLYEAESAWGDSLESIFRKAEDLIRSNEDWTPTQKSELYAHIARTRYYDDEFSEASRYAEKALANDSTYLKNILYCNILFDNKDSSRLKKVIINHIDSSEVNWTLRRKADILIDLGSYKEALEIYNIVQSKDSSMIDNEKMANIFEGVEQYELARTYYIKDTSDTWDESNAILNLFKHDLKYQSSELATQSYNAYRDLGFDHDPLAIYRIHLLIYHPSAGWSFRDAGGILLLLLIIALLILIPSIWVLPVYSIGHYYKIKPKFNLGNNWGLKAFWYVSAAYWLASLFSLFPTPEDINYYFNDSNYYEEDTSQLGFSTLIFILSLGALTLLTLLKKNIKVLGSPLIPYGKTFLQVLGYFFLYKVATGVYATVGTQLFGAEVLETIPSVDFLLSSRDDIISLIEDYQLLNTFLLVAVFVPIYEEVLFRGVILESCSKYITFRWANILQSFLFAAVHGELFLFPVFFAFGIVTGLLRKNTGGLLGGILFHVINNFFATIAIYKGMDVDFKALIFFGG